MDLTQLAVDAGQFINRAVQYTGESLGQAEKTDLDPRLEALLNQADVTKTWTEQIISQTEALLQPSPGARLEDRIYEHLEWSVPPRPRANELLGDHMTQAGMEFGSNTPYGTALIRCGEAQKQLGEIERKFVQSTNIHFLTPLRSFTEGQYTAIQNERKMLVNKRLDLDIAKSRLRKAHEADREARNLNSNPLQDDYVSQVSYMFSFLRVKWLKIWAQEISQAEMELRICQSLFDRQSEIGKRFLEGVGDTHMNHMQNLLDFVDAQSSYFAQCNQQSQELLRQISSIPTVFCSNNWQSGVNTAITQLPASGHVANEPLGIDEISPMPVAIHKLPDFNPDSRTINSHSLSKPQQNPTNNNNIFSALSQANGHHSLVTDPPSHTATLSETNTAKHEDELQARNRTDSPCVAATGAPSSTESVSATASTRVPTGACLPLRPNETPNEAHLLASETATPSAVVAHPQETNETHEQPVINGEDV